MEDKCEALGIGGDKGRIGGRTTYLVSHQGDSLYPFTELVGDSRLLLRYLDGLSR